MIVFLPRPHAKDWKRAERLEGRREQGLVFGAIYFSILGAAELGGLYRARWSRA